MPLRDSLFQRVAKRHLFEQWVIWGSTNFTPQVSHLHFISDEIEFLINIEEARFSDLILDIKIPITHLKPCWEFHLKPEGFLVMINHQEATQVVLLLRAASLFFLFLFLGGQIS